MSLFHRESFQLRFRTSLFIDINKQYLVSQHGNSTRTETNIKKILKQYIKILPENTHIAVQPPICRLWKWIGNLYHVSTGAGLARWKVAS